MPTKTPTTAEVRAAFNDAIARATDPDARARLELAREALTNPAFRAALADKLWAERAA